MFTYYDIDDQTCLLAVQPEAGFVGALLLTRKGQWKDGEQCALDHLNMGESGARQIDESEALALAAKLGGKWPPALG